MGGTRYNKKTPRGTGGLRVGGWADALADDQRVLLHKAMVAHVSPGENPRPAWRTATLVRRPPASLRAARLRA